MIHDSYYYHTCLIIPEKDVLKTDITGSGCGSHLARWWHDLFLLSYTSEISRRFYISSHAMRIERFRQYRKFKGRIHPMSKFRNFWNFLILHVFIMNKILFRYTSSFIFDDMSVYLYYCGAFFELIIIADLFVTLKTGYIDMECKKVILDSKASMIHFCTTKLFIYLASAFPLHWLMFLKYGSNVTCGLCKANRFICALKIIGVFSLYRVCEKSTYWNQKQQLSTENNYFNFLRIGAIAISTMSQYYDISDVVIMLIFINQGYVVKTSMLGLRAGFKYTNTQPTPNSMYICYDINRIFKSLILYSFDIKEKIYYLDKISSLFGYMLSHGFYIWIMLECYTLISRKMYPRDRIMRHRISALNMIACRQLSDDLRYKVEQYFDFRPARLKIVERKNELYRILPEVLKNEAKLSTYMNLIMRIPFFSDLPLAVLEKIVLILKREIFLKNDVVAEALVQNSGLMIVHDGVLAVYSQYQKEQGHLIDGDYFGEVSLVTDKELCTSFVVAITASTILQIEKNEFRNVMREYPKQFLGMKTQIKMRYNKTLVLSRRQSQMQSQTTETKEENL